MRTARQLNDYQPIAWLGRYPLYATGAIVCLHVLAMLAATILSSTGHSHAVGALMFSSPAVLTKFVIWQTVTYAFVHTPNLWFGVDMLFFYWFGREVERFLGRQSFLLVYLGLVLVPTLLLTATGGIFPGHLSGSHLVHSGIFVVFAAIYPSAELILRIQAKWLALILVALGVLAALNNRDWPSLMTIAATTLAALGLARSAGIGNAFAWLDSLTPSTISLPVDRKVHSGNSRPRRTPLPPARNEQPTPGASADIHTSIDPLLEKISRDGLDSLSSAERARLENARTELLGKDSGK